MARSTVYQMNYHNPHASAPLVLPVLVVCNTSDDDLKNNIRTNSARPDKRWARFEPAHEYTAILCGGGPSLADHLDEIRRLRMDKGVVFAMNGASKFLTKHGIKPDFQVIADAKPETATLIDTQADDHLFASQVHPSCFDKIPGAALWHLECEGIEDVFPEARKAAGGYALIGGGAAVGNSATCLAYVMGYRNLHLFGYDSSHRNKESHAYNQPMNRFIPTVDMEWAGKTFTCSVAMKAQAEKFQMTGQALKQAGCSITVHGDGLLPTMWNTPASDLGEKEKYKLVWQFDAYREFSPGENVVPTFLDVAKPDGLIIDFGCGTGRASVALAKQGHEVFLIDFADNCRDEEAINLPFLEWDLTKPIPARANYGICTDVMEHIPTKDVETVIRNIMEAGRKVFFQISTVKDVFGSLIGTDLHLTVKDHGFWKSSFAAMGYEVAWESETPGNSQFFITAIPQTEPQ